MSWSERPRRAFLLTLLPTLLLAACGFQLRGSASLGFGTMALAGQGGALHDTLQQRIVQRTALAGQRQRAQAQRRRAAQLEAATGQQQREQQQRAAWEFRPRH